MKARTLLVCSMAISLAFALAGCQNRENALVGKYKGSLQLPDTKDGKPIDDLTKTMASNLANMPLELKADRTFTMTMLMFPAEGTWKLEGDTLVLSVTEVMGMTVEEMKKQNPSSANTDKPMRLKVSPDNKTLTAIDDKPAEGTMVFTREK
jgi:hypothetical protein